MFCLVREAIPNPVEIEYPDGVEEIGNAGARKIRQYVESGFLALADSEALPCFDTLDTAEKALAALEPSDFTPYLLYFPNEDAQVYGEQEELKEGRQAFVFDDPETVVEEMEAIQFVTPGKRGNWPGLTPLVKDDYLSAWWQWEHTAQKAGKPSKKNVSQERLEQDKRLRAACAECSSQKVLNTLTNMKAGRIASFDLSATADGKNIIQFMAERGSAKGNRADYSAILILLLIHGRHEYSYQLDTQDAINDFLRVKGDLETLNLLQNVSKLLQRGYPRARFYHFLKQIALGDVALALELFKQDCKALISCSVPLMSHPMPSAMPKSLTWFGSISASSETAAEEGSSRSASP